MSVHSPPKSPCFWGSNCAFLPCPSHYLIIIIQYYTSREYKSWTSQFLVCLLFIARYNHTFFPVLCSSFWTRGHTQHRETVRTNIQNQWLKSFPKLHLSFLTCPWIYDVLDNIREYVTLVVFTLIQMSERKPFLHTVYSSDICPSDTPHKFWFCVCAS